MSSALPGVAVAVALVPPLAATGILLESHQSVLAEGSLLLFLTNLLAIIVSAIVVMLATRVIPTIRLFFVSPRVAITSIGILVATAAIAVPLTARSIHAASSSRLQEDVSAAVDAWLGNSPLDVVALEIDGSTATVELAGQTEPPPVYELATAHFGCARDEVLFVSSNGWDAAGAAGYGFITAWINRAGAPMDRLGHPPHEELRDLSMIPAMAVAI